MPKLGNDKRIEVIKLARQMRGDDMGWDTIMNDQRIKGLVNKVTLMKWLENPDDVKPKSKRKAKADDAALLKEMRAENARLQALVSDLLLGKIWLGKA